MSAAQTHHPAEMTVAEFLSRDSGDWTGRRCQLIDGAPVAMDPAGQTHAALVAEIARLLGNHLLERGSPCRVLVEPGIVPRANSARNTTIPSVQEILIVRSTRLEAELLRRAPDGTWPEPADVIHPPGALELASIGLAVPLASVYRTSGL